MSHPLQFALVALAGWINQQQRDVIDYLQEENRVLREQLGARRPRFTYDQRRRLAAKARTLGRRLLREFASVVITESCLEWIVLVGEASLRRAVREFAAHYHHECNHPGNQLIVPLADLDQEWLTVMRDAVPTAGCGPI